MLPKIPKILLVENELSWQGILKKLINIALERINLYLFSEQILTTSDNFSDALSYLNKTKWDLLITDIGLKNDCIKNKDGIELVKLAHYQNIPTLVVSATPVVSTDDVRNFFKDYDVKDFFNKGKLIDDRFVDRVQNILRPLVDEESNKSNVEDFIGKDFFNTLKEILAPLAACLGPQKFLRKLLQNSGLDKEVIDSISQTWTGVANNDVPIVISFAISYRPDKNRSFDSRFTLFEKLLFSIIQEEKLKFQDLKLISSNILSSGQICKDPEIMNILELLQIANERQDAVPILSQLNEIINDLGKKRNRNPLRLFYSYSHEDENFREELNAHLKILERKGLILQWHDRCIVAGDNWQNQIDENLENADIILLLISSDFINSEYCYNVEMSRALEHSEKGIASVIPILVREVNWSNSPFSHLLLLPSNGKAVKSWDDRDSAWCDVSQGIEKAILQIQKKSVSYPKKLSSPH